MAPLSWQHHTLIQALIHHGPLSEPDFQAIFAGVFGENPAKPINDTLRDINNELAFVMFELQSCINPNGGIVYYGLVNNVADEVSMFGTKYSVPQLAFYKGLLEAVLQEAGIDGSITRIDALNLQLDNQSIISLTQKEKTLDKLIRDRWLSHTSTGKIGLGIRSLLYLQNIPSCVVCGKVCIKASSCPNVGCNVRIHENCLRKKLPHRKVHGYHLRKLPQRKTSRACPGCGTEWPYQDE